MKYRKLGDSDLEVAEISLGSWPTYAAASGVSVDAQLFLRAERIIDEALSREPA